MKNQGISVMTKTLFAALVLFVLLSITLDHRWSIVKTKNNIEGRSECGLVEVDGKLYLVGGDGPAAKPIEVYDPRTNSWEAKAAAPVIMHHLQAVGLNHKVFVLEAFSGGGFPNQSPMSNSYSYDTKTDHWDKLAEIPADRRRAGAGSAIYNGKIYLVCGITNGHRSGTNAMFDEYDPSSNTWTTLPDAPHIRDHGQAVVIGDKLYAVGGRNTSFRDPSQKVHFFSQTVLEVDCYDFNSRTWTTLPQKLPLGSGGGTAVNFENSIYYIGGERATDKLPNAPQKDVYRLDPEHSSTWTKVSDLNIARNGVGGAVLDHKIYIAGGAGGPPPGGPSPNLQYNNKSEGPPQTPPGGGKPGNIEMEVLE